MLNIAELIRSLSWNRVPPQTREKFHIWLHFGVWYILNGSFYGFIVCLVWRRFVYIERCRTRIRIHTSQTFSIVVLVKLCWTIQITNNNENRNWDNLENDTIQTVEMGIRTEKWVSITAEISTKVNNMLIK